MSGVGDWSTEQLAEFIDGIAACESEDAAIGEAVQRIAGAVDAQVCAYVRDGEIRSSLRVGPGGAAPEAMLALVANPDAPTPAIEGIGDVHTMVAAVVGDLGGHFVLAREGRDFEPHERALVRSMGGALSLTLGKIQTLRAERERWSLLTRLSLLQRSISHHAPVREVLAAIVQAARELIGEPVAALALLEDDGRPVVRAQSGVQRDLHGIRMDALAVTQAIRRDSVTIIEELQEDPELLPELAGAGVTAAIIAPVREAGQVRGLLLVGSQTVGRRFSPPEQEALAAFAEHASLALTDAQLTDQIDRALHDAMTGLPNRQLLIETLAARLEDGSPTPALFTIDLDSFGDINDRIGHRSGDTLLTELGNRLLETTGPGTFVARLEGDSFAVLTTAEEAAELGGRILDATAGPFRVDGRELRTTASVGLVDFGSSADQILRDSDLAMHRAKGEGGARIVTFEPRMHTELIERLELQEDLARALTAGEIVAHFQPKVDLRSGRVVGVEALARWHHPERGLLLPADFLGPAEAGGEMQALTERVIEFSTGVAADWWHSGLGLQLSVNVAASLLSEPGWRLDEFVTRTLAEAMIPAEALQFEVTEDALMTDPGPASEMLSRLSELDSSISIDDFGTGHSSLARLKNLPIDELKIDRSFVADVTENDGDRTIVRATIYLAHQLGLQVVAEGIETEETWRQLRSMGCERGQGFLISEPLPGRDVLAWLAAWNRHARRLTSIIRSSRPPVAPSEPAELPKTPA
jgi:diguanylate cyclase (GGDEF)-like protein